MALAAESLGAWHRNLEVFMFDVVAFVDGSSRGNPGPGGWGAVLECAGRRLELSGVLVNTTNSRAELEAVLGALRALKCACRVSIYSDSQYVVRGFSVWLPDWLKSGWRTASKKPVANRDLWEAVLVETAKHQVSFHWVAGHAGESLNERAHVLAFSAELP